MVGVIRITGPIFHEIVPEMIPRSEHTMFLMKSLHSCNLCLLEVMPCQPKPCYRCQEWARKVFERGEEAVVDNLPQDEDSKVGNETQDNIPNCKFCQNTTQRTGVSHTGDNIVHKREQELSSIQPDVRTER
jgi:hypothetical protein